MGWVLAEGPTFSDEEIALILGVLAAVLLVVLAVLAVMVVAGAATARGLRGYDTVRGLSKGLVLLAAVAAAGAGAVEPWLCPPVAFALGVAIGWVPPPGVEEEDER